MLSLAGKGAIIVGTRRIGAAVTERLAREGVRPAIVYRNSRDDAERLRSSVAPLVDRSCVIQGDLTVEDDVKRIVSEADDTLGDISFCVNLASDYPRTPLAALDAVAWDKGMAAAKGAYLLALHSARRMMANAGPTRGHILLFGDWAAQETPYEDFLPYLTGKAAVLFMTRGFALELAPQGILVNSISPGPTMRPADLSQEVWDQALQSAPLRRESSADDIAEIVATLLKLETVTGQDTRVDSGRHLAGSANV